MLIASLNEQHENRKAVTVPLWSHRCELTFGSPLIYLLLIAWTNIVQQG
jgi:hypothetical protein